MLLRHECLYPAEILSVSHQHDLAAHIDAHLLELLKIRWRTVVGINHVRFYVARGRHAVKWRDHAGVILKRIGTHPFPSRAMHGDPGRRGHVDADFRGIVHPDAVFDNFGFEAGIAKLPGDVVGCGLVLRSTGHVRRLGQDAQVLFGQLRVGYSQKAAFHSVFGGGIAIAKNRNRGRVLYR